jgi:hypothetical protein
MKLQLLSFNADAKTRKGNGADYLTAILYLAPAKIAGRGEVCSHRSVACTAACLFTAGRGQMNSVQSARVRKTQLFFDNSAEFLRLLREDIVAFQAYCAKRGAKACVRLNGTSDIPWERFKFFSDFPSVQFYDYTKNPVRMMAYCNRLLPANYHLTFSRSESNEAQALQVLRDGGNVAVVFSSASFPAFWNGIEVASGDETDLRFTDPRNCVIGLKAKGKAKQDASGFVVHA